MLKPARQLLIVLIVSLPVSQAVCAEYLLGIVPQQSSTKMVRHWIPITNYIYQQSGIKIKFATAPTIPIFEKRLAEGLYDVAYMNPYQYMQYHKHPGYTAFVKARNKKIIGIIVVHKDSAINSLKQLHKQKIVFPSGAFAATLLPRAFAQKVGVKLYPAYVRSHDSVYRNVAHKRYVAGGGVVRTLRAMAPEIASQLRILWTSKGFTPHAIAYHPRVPVRDMESIKAALLKMQESKEGRKLLRNIKITGFESAKDQDWNDIRKLKLKVNE